MSENNKPTPQLCRCGKRGVVIKSRQGWICSCPNPLKCTGNIRTSLCKSEADAIKQWNKLLINRN